jgi:glycosyltransferase involved in cell wall biosynthesis
MKILYIAPRYTGGIGGHAATVAAKLRDHGFDVKQMDVSHIPIKNLKNPSFAMLGALKAFFGSEHYDVAHAWNVPSAFVMRAAKAQKKVLSVHGVYAEQVEALHYNSVSTLVNMAEPKVLKWADKLTTDSKAVQKVYKERLGFEFEYLPAPLDTKRFKDIPKVSKVEDQVAYVGRDSYEKGIDILRSIEPQIKGKVVYCTDLPWNEAMSTLKASSMLVIPSRMESIPQVIKEAFYLKIPVVATNVGGIPELITNDVNGILVPPNDPKKLTDAINLLLENKEYAKKLIDVAYEYLMKNLTWDVLLPKYVEFYEKLIST